MTQTLIVSSEAELVDAYEALSNLQGGGEIHLTHAFEGQTINLNGANAGTQPVTIRSADPDDPVSISRISTNDVDNMRISDLKVSSDGIDRDEWRDDLSVVNSRNIELENIEFTSIATEWYDPDDPDAVLAETLGTIRDSSGVSFSNNTVSGYYQGLSVLETTDIEIRGNDISHMQGDGIRMGGVENITVADNYMHDFFGAVHSFNHNDMIQVWSTNTTIVSNNITISGNILDAGDGAAAQAIFFNNEALFAHGDTDHVYTNINITDNLIYNGHYHGITVGGADGVTIDGNTVLWNSDAVQISHSGEEGVSTIPGIDLFQVTGATVTNNIAGRYEIDGAQTGGNELIDYIRPNNPDYVGNHFVNTAQGGDVVLDDLRLRADSDWIGTGSDHTAPLLQSEEGVTSVVTSATASGDNAVMIFDASYSVDEDGFVDPADYTFRWTFGDGTVREGAVVAHRFDEPGNHDVQLQILQNDEVMSEDVRNYDVASNDLIMLNFDGGLEDTSDYDTILAFEGNTTNQGADGNGFRIGGGDDITASRNNDHFHDLESFGISLDIQVLGDSEGRFIHHHGVMWGQVDENGVVSFRLDTDEGSFSVDSGDLSIHDGNFHEVAIGYSDVAGQLVLSIDGTVVDSIDANGVTAGQNSQLLVFGNNFGDSVDAVLDNIYVGISPSDAGVTIPGAEIDQATLDATLVDPDAPPALPAKATPEIGPLVLPAYRTEAPPEENDSDWQLALDFESDPQDTGVSFPVYDTNALVDHEGGTGYRIGGYSKLTVDRGTSELHELDSFAFGMDVQFDDFDAEGRFMRFYQVFEASLDGQGNVAFQLKTDAGDHEVTADASVLTDGGVHRFEIAYSSADRFLEMRIDGDVVGRVEAWGTTAEQKWWGLTLGDEWHSSPDGVIDNVIFGHDVALLDGGAASGAKEVDTIQPTTLPSAVEAVVAAGSDGEEIVTPQGTEPEGETALNGETGSVEVVGEVIAPAASLVAELDGGALNQTTPPASEVPETWLDQLFEFFMSLLGIETGDPDIARAALPQPQQTAEPETLTGLAPEDPEETAADDVMSLFLSPEQSAMELMHQDQLAEENAEEDIAA